MKCHWGSKKAPQSSIQSNASDLYIFDQVFPSTTLVSYHCKFPFNLEAINEHEQ
jgi:hypothetical protein